LLYSTDAGIRIFTGVCKSSFFTRYSFFNFFKLEKKNRFSFSFFAAYLQTTVSLPSAAPFRINQPPRRNYSFMFVFSFL
jgi:hypothetical protein